MALRGDGGVGGFLNIGVSVDQAGVSDALALALGVLRYESTKAGVPQPMHNGYGEVCGCVSICRRWASFDMVLPTSASSSSCSVVR